MTDPATRHRHELIADLIECKKRIYDLEDEIKAMRDVAPRWVPVSERLPVVEGSYFVKLKSGYYDYFNTELDTAGWDKVTHWLEGVPPLPKDGE